MILNLLLYLIVVTITCQIYQSSSFLICLLYSPDPRSDVIDHMGFHHLSYLHLFSIVDLFSFIIILKKN